MANLLDLLKNQLDDNMIGQLSSQLGADPQQTATAAESIFGTLVAGLAKNASTPDGAASLNRALERDNHSSILDSLGGGGGLMGMLGGLLGGNDAPAPQAPKAADGAGILGHILGGRQSGATDMISQISGLNQSKTGSLMAMLAPMVMAMLSKQKQSNGLDSGGLSDLLSGSVSKQKESGNPIMDLATRFLDKDGDGSMMDDVAGMLGQNVLGKIFGR